MTLLHYTRLLITALVLASAPALVVAQSEETSADTLRRTPFVTLRNRTGDPEPARYFGGARSTPKAGYCDVTQTDLSAFSAIAEMAPFRIPEEILSLDTVTEVSADGLFDALQVSAEGRSPLLYTHGYYVDFEKGCRRATILREAAGLDGRFLWFSWPSDGDLLNYAGDESDLYWSAPSLERLIADLVDRFGAGEVDVAGHSLGARGVMLALDGLAARYPETRVGEVVLLAADIDFQIFEQILPRIAPIARGITIYVADADTPLAISRQLHGYPRLGETGNNVASLSGVEVIDISALPLRSPTGHLYHVYNPRVAQDLAALLTDGLRARDRPGLTQVGDNLWRLKPSP